jgi:hypothetical protein
MKSIPRATAITLTPEEQAALEGLSRSTKSEARMRFTNCDSAAVGHH